MIFTPRLSQLSIDSNQKQLAIVHRQGNNTAYVILAAIVMYCLVMMVILARQSGIDSDFGLFAILTLISILIYLLETIILRKLIYSVIIHNQAIKHPKLLLSTVIYVLTLIPVVPNRLQFIAVILLALSAIDAIVQNQMHDIISIIRPNYWEIITAIPVLHIPFQQEFERARDEDDSYLVSVDMKSAQTNSRTNLSEEEITDLIHQEGPYPEFDYIEVTQVQPNPSPHTQPKTILVARFEELERFREALATINDLIKVKFVDLKK